MLDTTNQMQSKSEFFKIYKRKNIDFIFVQKIEIPISIAKKQGNSEWTELFKAFHKKKTVLDS